MPDDPRSCPDCAKVILNGDIAGENLKASAAHLTAICETIERHLDGGFLFSNLSQLLIKANELEDLSNDYQKKVDKFRKAVLEGLGFNGPWPKSLT